MSVLRRFADWGEARIDRRIGEDLDRIGAALIDARALIESADREIFAGLEGRFPGDVDVRSIRAWFELVYEDLEQMRDAVLIGEADDQELLA